jgi:hypothetical protein
MSNKVKQTTRKFYNKWTHKLSFVIKGISVIRTRSLDDAAVCAKGADICSFAKELSNFDPTHYAKRIESNTIDIYTNDPLMFVRLYTRFKDMVRLAFEPHPDLNDTDISGHTVLVKKLPHDLYRFKVFLQPHKVTSQEDKKKYINWLETQSPKIRISDTVKNWFHKTHWNWDRRYMYVEDEQMLLMLKLKNPEALGTVYTFVVSDK